MSGLIEIIADIIGLITGKKAETTFKTGKPKSSYIWLALFLLVVLVMGFYAIYAIAHLVIAK